MAEDPSEEYVEVRIRRDPNTKDFGLTILAHESGWHTITNVETGGMGEKAGLRVGDKICEVEGQQLPRKLHSIVSYLPGRDEDREVKLGVRRKAIPAADVPMTDAPKSVLKIDAVTNATAAAATAAATAGSKVTASATAPVLGSAPAASAPAPTPAAPAQAEPMEVDERAEGAREDKKNGLPGLPNVAAALPKINGEAAKETTEEREEKEGNAFAKNLSKTLSKTIPLPGGNSLNLCAPCASPRKKKSKPGEGLPARASKDDVAA